MFPVNLLWLQGPDVLTCKINMDQLNETHEMSCDSNTRDAVASSRYVPWTNKLGFQAWRNYDGKYDETSKVVFFMSECTVHVWDSQSLLSSCSSQGCLSSCWTGYASKPNHKIGSWSNVWLHRGTVSCSVILIKVYSKWYDRHCAIMQVRIYIFF